MVRRSSRTVWIAKVSFTDRRPAQLKLVHERFPEALRRALDPRASVVYYREWRLSHPEWHDGGGTGTVSAQLGFRRRKRQEEVDYDDTLLEWFSSETPARQGNFAHFVVDLETQMLAFEDRGDDLKRDSFLNALSLFLRTSGLEVNLISDTKEFDAWLDSVDVVTRFRVTLRQPNPGWSKRARQVRELASEIEPDWLTIEAQSETGLKVRDTLLDGAADTAAMGNGSFKVTGRSGSARRFFDSAKRFVSGIVEVADHDSHETITAKIRDLLHEIAPDPPQPDDDE